MLAGAPAPSLHAALAGGAPDDFDEALLADVDARAPAAAPGVLAGDTPLLALAASLAGAGEAREARALARLLRAGADAHARDALGASALDVAERAGKAALARALRAAGAETDAWPVAAPAWGARVAVTAAPRAARAGDAGDTTGRVVWECGVAMVRWLERGGACAWARVLGGAARGAARGLELSAGAGWCALALAAGGAARVVATETGGALAPLRANVARGPLGARVAVAEHAWGRGGLRAAAGGRVDFAFCSDVLYIALRDGLGGALAASVGEAAALAAPGALLFGFEERLVDDEARWLAELPRAARVRLEELPRAECALARDDALPRAREDAPDVFWEAPPIRIFVVTSEGEGGVE